jgi:hypothetical protein
MHRIRRACAFLATALAISCCSPPQNSAHKNAGVNPTSASSTDQPTADGSWESGETTDQYTEKDTLIADSNTSVEDGHNGKIHTEITFEDNIKWVSDTKYGIQIRLTYLNDLKDQQNACANLSIGSNANNQMGIPMPFQSRNETGDILGIPNPTENKGCNVIAILYPDQVVAKVLQSSDFRIKLFLVNGSDPVIRMDFQHNKALHEFADNVRASIEKL